VAACGPAIYAGVILIRIKLEQERTKKTESLIYLSVSSVAARKD
jgi:hypothetical protein